MTAALSLADAGNWSVNLTGALPFYGQQTALNVIGVTLGPPSKRNFFRTKRAVVLHITLNRRGKAYG
jgi:hypothetical protein